MIFPTNKMFHRINHYPNLIDPEGPSKIRGLVEMVVAGFVRIDVETRRIHGHDHPLVGEQ